MSDIDKHGSLFCSRQNNELSPGILSLIYVIVSLSLVTTGAEAVLLDRGGGLVYDTVLDITWLSNANYAATELSDTRVNEIISTVGSVSGHILTPADFLKDNSGDYTGQMTWWGALAWADQLVYLNSAYGVSYSDWRLPQTDFPDTACTNLNGTPRSDSIGYNCAGGELDHLFYGELGGVASQKAGSLLTSTTPTCCYLQISDSITTITITM